MTQVIFPTIVYRQIISLIIHSITIPVGQKFTYTKLAVPLNRNQPRPQKTVWFILGSNFQMSDGTRSSVQTIVGSYKNHGTTQPSYLSGRRRVLSPRDERTLVWKVQINPRETAKDPVKMLEETGTKVSISTVKQVLYRRNLKGHSARKSHSSKTAIKSQTTVCNCTWGQRLYFLEKCPLVWWNKNRTVWP